MRWGGGGGGQIFPLQELRRYAGATRPKELHVCLSYEMARHHSRCSDWTHHPGHDLRRLRSTNDNREAVGGPVPTS